MKKMRETVRKEEHKSYIWLSTYTDSSWKAVIGGYNHEGFELGVKYTILKDTTTSLISLFQVFIQKAYSLFMQFLCNTSHLGQFQVYWKLG